MGIIGRDPSVVLQVQPVTCCDHNFGILYEFEVYSIDSSQTVSYIREVQDLGSYPKGRPSVSKCEGSSPLSQKPNIEQPFAQWTKP